MSVLGRHLPIRRKERVRISVTISSCLVLFLPLYLLYDISSNESWTCVCIWMILLCTFIPTLTICITNERSTLGTQPSYPIYQMNDKIQVQQQLDINAARCLSHNYFPRNTQCEFGTEIISSTSATLRNPRERNRIPSTLPFFQILLCTYYSLTSQVSLNLRVYRIELQWFISLLYNT